MQSRSLVQLVNSLDHYVAFKLKATAAKKYPTSPYIGVVRPKSTRETTVRMQAPLVASDMEFKDKLLIESIIVPFGTCDKATKSSMFYKEGIYIEKQKLNVIFISPTN
ncbi:vesicle-associated protein 2-2-like [Papaver somniferum]|uniref:vesicle-associated protein 2-2-like n=1 Tax=Papaver somniferum TaxID=3469 RepID=UPI000E6F833F|nr:vesicle-associated protein 2-2-like [Papaver somniferum]XP_026383803.1 vesicle-associated protein 2-2-like [Papaver somniferum]